MLHIATETLASTAKLQQGTSVERTTHYSGALGISHLLCDTEYLDVLSFAVTKEEVTCMKCLSVVLHVASDRAACEPSLKEVNHIHAQSVISTLASIARARPHPDSTLVVRSADALAIYAYVAALSGKAP